MAEFLGLVFVVGAAAAAYWGFQKVRASRARKKAQQGGSSSGPDQTLR